MLLVQELLAPLATAATAALERWETEQPQALRAVAPEIVPLLDPYLIDMAALASDSRVADVSQGMVSRGVNPNVCLLLEDA